MPPPQLFAPEWFLKHVVDKRYMKGLGERIVMFYDDLFEEIVYRAYHNSIKVEFADVFYNDFKNYIVRSCGLKRNFWRYLPEGSTLRYMHEKRKKFFQYLKKPKEKRKYRMFGDIRWPLGFWLSQLSFWYVTVKAFQELWQRVREKKVGTIVVAELSRLSRRMRTLVNFLYDCFDNNVMIISIREGWLEEALRNKVVRPIIIAMFSTLYELERKLISERTKAGLARAKSQGKKIGGQFKLSDKEVKELIRLYKEGVPVKRLAERFGVSRATVYRYLIRGGVFKNK